MAKIHIKFEKLILFEVFFRLWSIFCSFSSNHRFHLGKYYHVVIKVLIYNFDQK